MPTNDYKAFAYDSGANVLSPTSYAASGLVPDGHQPGVANSAVANTTWRQTSVAAAALAQFICDQTGVDMLDDGDAAGFETKLIAALGSLANGYNHWKTGDVKSTLDPNDQTGWVFANGQAISRTGAGAALFAKFGTTYGAGDGSTTFNVPQLCAEFLRGVDAGRGVDPGRTLGSAQAGAIESHRHSLPSDSLDNTGDGYVADSVGGGIARTAYSGYTGGSETRPRNVAVRFLIKL